MLSVEPHQCIDAMCRYICCQCDVHVHSLLLISLLNVVDANIVYNAKYIEAMNLIVVNVSVHDHLE